jgi:hypothetical protein
MKFDDFYPYIAPEVLGCPDPIMRNAVNLAAIDFTRETLCWTELQSPIKLVENTPDYELDIPAGAYMTTVRDVWCGARRLAPKTMAEIQEALPDWQTSTSSQPSFYNQGVDRGSIRIYPTPASLTGAETIVVRAAYVPTAAATTLPDFLGQRHLDVISSGAKSRLMFMSSAPWANKDMAVFYKQVFDDGVIKSKIDEAHDRVRGSISVKPRTFGL